MKKHGKWIRTIWTTKKLNILCPKKKHENIRNMANVEEIRTSGPSMIYENAAVNKLPCLKDPILSEDILGLTVLCNISDTIRKNRMWWLGRALKELRQVFQCSFNISYQCSEKVPDGRPRRHGWKQ